MFRSSYLRRGVTLVEILVAAGLLGLVMTAVISFYVEAIAVSAKKDEQSARLRRFHLGLDKMEQIMREGRLIDLKARSLLFLKLSKESELDGFPSYDITPAQLASTEKGVVLVQDGKEIPILLTEPGENIIFSWVHEDPFAMPAKPPKRVVFNIALYYSGKGERSGLFFHRTINTPTY